MSTTTPTPSISNQIRASHPAIAVVILLPGLAVFEALDAPCTYDGIAFDKQLSPVIQKSLDIDCVYVARMPFLWLEVGAEAGGGGVCDLDVMSVEAHAHFPSFEDSPTVWTSTPKCGMRPALTLLFVDHTPQGMPPLIYPRSSAISPPWHVGYLCMPVIAPSAHPGRALFRGDDRAADGDDGDPEKGCEVEEEEQCGYREPGGWTSAGLFITSSRSNTVAHDSCPAFRRMYIVLALWVTRISGDLRYRSFQMLHPSPCRSYATSALTLKTGRRPYGGRRSGDAEVSLHMKDEILYNLYAISFDVAHIASVITASTAIATTSSTNGVRLFVCRHLPRSPGSARSRCTPAH
ncbi:hypothetical protein R3P38DRAFT_3206230 [Favolaschia claudopus]|uniref:Uncharacterized protein n=1 Tax=Favolaschia claudopus TaxID=2862362 RepID=A0AAW0AKC4_9AGAR